MNLMNVFDVIVCPLMHHHSTTFMTCINQLQFLHKLSMNLNPAQSLETLCPALAAHSFLLHISKQL